MVSQSSFLGWTIILSLDINYDDKFFPLLRRFNPAEPVVEKSVIL
jgi:hypothetical protein